MGAGHTLIEKRDVMIKKMQTDAYALYGKNVTVEYVGDETKAPTHDVPIYVAKDKSGKTIAVGMYFDDFKPKWFDIRRKER